MVDEVPVGLAQTLTAHDDEVLHVTFSHDGKQISSCSKDHHILIWNGSEEGHFTEHYRLDMAHYGWMHTWASQYNRSDTKLLVSGVVNSVGGEVAVFSTGRGTTEKYEFLCRMVNDPYDFLGCWCSDDYVITGTMTADNENNFVSAVWLCKTESDEFQAAAEQQGLLPMAGPPLPMAGPPLGGQPGLPAYAKGRPPPRASHAPPRWRLRHPPRWCCNTENFLFATQRVLMWPHKDSLCGHTEILCDVT